MSYQLQETHTEIIAPAPLNYEQASTAIRENVWSLLDTYTIGQALEIWLDTLGKTTAINYRSGMKRLIEAGLINTGLSLQHFAVINHEAVVDRVKTQANWSECTRQARAACYISFTGFLSRRFQGLIKKAVTSKEGTNKTFFRVHEKVKTNAMTQSQWIAFFRELEKINPRDCLISKIILQGGKRVNEVLSLQAGQICWEKNEITFTQSKTKGTHRETVISYPVSVMASLKEYIGNRTGHTFITKNQKPVMITQLASSFNRAGVMAGIPFKVTPHVLRASTVTYLKQQGFADSDVMKVTGHASAEMVFAYDKTSRADNASKKVALVS